MSASLTKSEGYVYHNLIDKRTQVRPKYEIVYPVRTADFKKLFSNGDTTI